MIIHKIKELLLKTQTSSGLKKRKYIKEVQTIIWNDDTIEDEKLNSILTDMAYILDFYEPNEKWRKEAPNYYGETQLKKEISIGIKKIEDYQNP